MSLFKKIGKVVKVKVVQNEKLHELVKDSTKMIFDKFKEKVLHNDGLKTKVQETAEKGRSALGTAAGAGKNVASNVFERAKDRYGGLGKHALTTGSRSMRSLRNTVLYIVIGGAFAYGIGKGLPSAAVALVKSGEEHHHHKDKHKHEQQQQQ